MTSTSRLPRRRRAHIPPFESWRFRVDPELESARRIARLYRYGGLGTPGRRQRTAAKWLLLGVSALVLWPLLAFMASGCALAHVRPDGTLDAVVVGKATVERCVEERPGPKACSKVRGGSVSEAAGDMIGSIGGALFGWLAL